MENSGFFFHSKSGRSILAKGNGIPFVISPVNGSQATYRKEVEQKGA